MARACALFSERHWLPPRVAIDDVRSAVRARRLECRAAQVQRAADVIARSRIADCGLIADRSGRAFAERTSRFVAPSLRVTRTASRSVERLDRPNVLLARARARRWLQRAAFAAASFSSPSTSVEIHSPIRNHAVRSCPQSGTGIASVVDREWLVPTVSELVHRYDQSSGRVRAALVDRYDALVLAERPAAARSRNRRPIAG